MGRPISRLLSIASLASGLSLLPSLAWSQQTARCDSPEHQRGRELRQQGRDQDAYELFRGIFEREHTVCAQARMGLALQALGRWVEAESALSAALQNNTDAWLAGARGQLQEQLTVIRSHIGEVDVLVQSDVEGAELYVNGSRVGILPLTAPVRINAGTAVIEVRATGYATVRRSVEVVAGGRSRESITLVATAEPVVTGPTPVATPVAPTRPSPASPGQVHRVFGGILLGTSVLSFATGIALWVRAEQNFSEYSTSATCRTWDQSPDQLCPTLWSAANSQRRGGISALGLGAAFAGTGIALIVLAPRAQRTTASVGCAPDLSNPGLLCAGRF